MIASRANGIVNSVHCIATVPHSPTPRAFVVVSHRSHLCKGARAREDEIVSVGLIAKYIEKIEIDDDVIDMSAVKIRERINLIENLPLSIYTDLTNFAQKLNSYEQEIVTIDGKEVAIDSAFFDSSISR